MAVRQVLRTISVAEAATNSLRESLFAGLFEAGEEISDTQVADEYGIARPTARIAVQQLINEGMLVRDPGYSARVRIFDPRQVSDIFRARKVVELDAVRELKSSGASLARVKNAMDRFVDLGANPDWSMVAEADSAFHQAVVEAGGSERLGSYFDAITKEIRLLLALPETHFGRGESPFEEHEELFLLLRDESTTIAQVEAAWEYHLDESRDFLIGHLSM